MPDSLFQKLANVLKEVERIEKRGHNAHHNYDYVTESDVVEALRKHLAEAGIVCVPFVEKVTTTPTEKGLMAHVEVSYKFTNGSENIQVRVVGSGYDIPGDKAVYKAMTGALKYALRQLFLIPTGDDPERDEKDHSDARPERNDVQRESRTQSRNRGSKDSERAVSDEGSARQDSSGPRASSSEATVKFGRSKGKRLSELKEDELVWWTKVCEESVAKNDAKWHQKNVEALDACQSEWARRQPWREVWALCLEIGSTHGLDEDGVKVVLKEQLGITSADKLTEGDLAKFQNALTQ